MGRDLQKFWKNCLISHFLSEKNPWIWVRVSDLGPHTPSKNNLSNRPPPGQRLSKHAGVWWLSNPPGLSIRCESDDVIWLRNHAYTWMLVPNIGCSNKPWRQILADRLLFFWCSDIFFPDYPMAIRRGEISLKSNHVIERKLEAANGRITENRAYNVWVISHVICKRTPTIPGTTAMYTPLYTCSTPGAVIKRVELQGYYVLCINF